MSTQNKTAIPNSLNEHWMPFTSNKDFKENPRLIVEAKGVYLKNHQGQTQIDASSGLFCNPLGHGREEIIEAITMDETSIKLMGKEGRKNIIKKFNVEKMCFSTYSEYKRLLN